MSALSDFLAAERLSTDEMSAEDMANEVNGWRAFVSMVPPECVEWVARLGGDMTFLTRKYEGKEGVLVGVRFEPSEFSIEVLEPGFDRIRGVRTIECKVIHLEPSAILYYEDTLSKQDYEDYVDEQNLAKQSLEG